MLHRLTFLVRLLIAVLPASVVAPAAAGAMTPQAARAKLRVAGLHPAPLYPFRLPAAVRSSHASVSITARQFSVVWDRGCCSAPGLNRGYLSLGRAGYGQLGSDLSVSRSRGFAPRRVRVGSRRVWRVCGHICGYDWQEQGFTYQAFGIYYAKLGSEARDLRIIITRLRRLT
jgi:hypothetical protein